MASMAGLSADFGRMDPILDRCRVLREFGDQYLEYRRASWMLVPAQRSRG
jgi:hypothetical protein